VEAQGHQVMSNWYFLIDAKEGGPIESAELRSIANSGRLKPNDKVRREGMTEWHEARQIKGLFGAGGSQATSSPTQAPATASSVGNGANQSAANENGFSRTKAPGSRKASPPLEDVSAGSSRTAFATESGDDLHSHWNSVWKDLRSMNFWEEIVPIDSTNIVRMLKDPVIVSVTCAAIAPLVIITLRPDLQLAAFAMLFAFLWGMVFKHYIVRANVTWKILSAALLFTGIFGISLLLASYVFLLPRVYVDLAASPNPVVSLIGFVFQTGICEELCKIIPVAAYLAWKRRKADPKVAILIGVFSGLGFAAFENLSKEGEAIARTFGLTMAKGAEGLRAGVEGAMVNVLTRSLSLVFVPNRAARAALSLR
jgi:hypothetical protein